MARKEPTRVGVVSLFLPEDMPQEKVDRLLYEETQRFLDDWVRKNPDKDPRGLSVTPLHQ